jgi:hypothetical protein
LPDLQFLTADRMSLVTHFSSNGWTIPLIVIFQSVSDPTFLNHQDQMENNGVLLQAINISCSSFTEVHYYDAMHICKYVNDQMGYSGAWGKLIHEKKPKFSWHCPLHIKG